VKDRVCVGARFWDTALILIGGGAVMAAVLTYREIGLPRGNAAYSWIPAGVFLGIFLLRLAHIVRNRRWITPAHDGLVLDARGRRVFVADDQVDDLAYTSRLRYDSGRAVGTRTEGQLLVGTGGPPVRFRFRHDVPFDRHDPLAEVFDRILNGLTHRVGAELSAHPLAGTDWELDSEGLTIGGGHGRRVLPIRDVAAVDLLEAKVCVWAVGEPTPCLRVPADSPGALVLARLLARELQDNPRAEGDDHEGLGRVLFERAKSSSVAAAVGLLLLLGSLSAAAGCWAVGEPTGATLGATFAAVTSPVCLHAWFSRRNVFRCCTRGVFQRTAFGSAELRYENVGSFTYGATRHYVNGAYTGTKVEMQFRPRTRAAGRPINFSASLDGGDEELDDLRQHIARVIAGRMRRRLADGQAVDWTSDVGFRPDGLEIAARVGLFRRLEVRVLPYDHVAGIDLKDGVFYLFEHGRKRAVYQTPVSVENFFPGFELLQHLLAGTGEACLTRC
jgi:hypothetical protein